MATAWNLLLQIDLKCWFIFWVALIWQNLPLLRLVLNQGRSNLSKLKVISNKNDFLKWKLLLSTLKQQYRMHLLVHTYPLYSFTQSAIMTKNNTNSQDSISTQEAAIATLFLTAFSSWSILMFQEESECEAFEKGLSVCEPTKLMQERNPDSYVLWSGFWTIVKMPMCKLWRYPLLEKCGCWDASLPLQLEFSFSMEMYIGLVIVLLYYWSRTVLVTVPKFHGCEVTSCPLPGDLHTVQRTVVSST